MQTKQKHKYIDKRIQKTFINYSHRLGWYEEKRCIWTPWKISGLRQVFSIWRNYTNFPVSTTDIPSYTLQSVGYISNNDLPHFACSQTSVFW